MTRLGVKCASTSVLALRAVACLSLLVSATAAPAYEYQFNGFAAQGFALSKGNNAYGESTSGSFKLYELGLNGTLSTGNGLLFSAQGLLRDAGGTDNEGLRLDYALADYQFLASPDANAGIRAGRVKNPLGLFNETRDVVFARPGIALPQSVYFESQGFRRFLFSSDGAQLYGGFSQGDHYFSVTAGAGRGITASEDEERQLLAAPFPGNVRFSKFRIIRLQDEVGGGRWRFAISHLQTRLSLEPDSGVPLNGQADFRLYALSAQHNAERYSLTAEYLLQTSKGNFSQTGPINSKGEGAYLQADYRFMPNWSAMLRYDASFANRNDRNGREFAAQTGGDRHSQFAKDTVGGLSWRPDEHWGVWGEYHLIDGTSSVSSLDNVDRQPEKHWNLFLLMVSYRF